MPELTESEFDIQEVKKRALVGVTALISRSFIIQIVSLLANLALTFYLSPSVYGIYYLVLSVTNFLAYFSDIGLAAALIQKKEKITREDLVTTFTIQQSLVLFLLLLLYLFTPLIRNSYHISQDGIYLLWALGLSLLLSSLKTVPSIILERNIQFNKLIIPQITETLVFNIIAVYLASRGYGVATYTYAVIARGLVGLLTMYLVSPWRPSLGVNRQSLSHLLKYGIPYQTNTFLAVIKDDGMNILLGRLIGTEGFGYIAWAKRWPETPLRIFMDNVTKVAFPAFSRLQHDKENLGRAIETSLKYLTLVVFPVLVAMGFLVVPLIRLVPGYTKWLPAVIPFYLYLVNSAWASVSTMLTNTLNAIGRVKTTFKLMVMWVTLTWVLMPFLAVRLGYVGVSIAAVLISFSSVAVIFAVRRHVPFSLLRSVSTSLISSFVLGVYLLLVRSFANSISSFVAVSLGGVLVYLAAIFMLEGKDFIARSLNYFRPQHA